MQNPKNSHAKDLSSLNELKTRVLKGFKSGHQSGLDFLCQTNIEINRNITLKNNTQNCLIELKSDNVSKVKIICAKAIKNT